MNLQPTSGEPPELSGPRHPDVTSPASAEPAIPLPRSENDAVELVMDNIVVRKRPALAGTTQTEQGAATTAVVQATTPVRSKPRSPQHRRPEPPLTWMVIIDRILGSWPRTRRALLLIVVLGAALALLTDRWGAWGFGWTASLGAAFLVGAGVRG